MLTLNQFGLLADGPVIPSTITEFKTTFVDNIPTPERLQYFNAYINYSSRLKSFCGGEKLRQWIDGSFVTSKPNPGDIDMITFIDSRILSVVSTEIGNFIYPQSKEIFGVDAYIVYTYPSESRKFFRYQSDVAYWRNQFGTTRPNRAGKKRKKGFLEIVY